MSQISLYAQKQNAGTTYSSYQELDLYKSEPIKLSKSVQGLFEPQATTSSFSRSFRVPNTSPNGVFFQAVFNVNSTDFDATQKASAYINVDGAFFVAGNIRLQNIIRNDFTGKIEYEIIFMGETSTFGSIVGPRDLSALNFSRYAHNLTYQNVTKSWQPGVAGLYNGDIVYPLAEYGYDYDANNQPTQTTVSVYTGAAGGLKGFTKNTVPYNNLEPNQFKPAIRAKVVWDQIFSEAGFTYNSTFLNTALFKNLYMMSSNVATSVQTPSVAFIATTDEVYYPTNSGGPQQAIPLLSKSVDFANAVILPTGYKAPYTGSPYTFVVEDIICDYILSGSPLTANFTLQLLRNGVVVGSQQAYVNPNYNVNVDYAQNVNVWPATTPNPTTFTFSASATAGDIFSLAFVAPNKYNQLALQQAEFSGSGPAVMDPASIMPFQYKQLEFIKAINDRFKLVWEPDPENPKNFYIEPWKNWVTGGTERDWTDYLDESKDISITPLFYSQTRELVFRDSEEGDIYNFLFQQQNKETFGELKQDSNIEILTGSKQIKSLFSPTPLAPIGNSNTFIIPHFAKDTETKREPIQIKPRLLFYNGLVTAPIPWRMNNNGVSVLQNQYPLISSFDKYPFNQNSLDINWTNSPQYWSFNNVGFSGRTSKTAFTEYWQRWFDFTYNPYSRIMEATFSLSDKEISKLRFNDKIWVKDAWWMVQDIKDYVLGARQNVRVTLLKIGDFNYGVGVGGDTKWFPQDNISYSISGDDCQACCGQAEDSINIYSNAATLATSTQLFWDSTGLVYAPTGAYSDGTDSYVVGNFGQITTVTACSGCSCVPGTETEITNVYYADNLNDVCCGNAPTTSVFADTVSLELATIVYGASGGTPPLIPGYYYKAPGDGSAILVGENGTSVQSVIDCSNSSCSELPVEEYLSSNETPVLACCVEPGTDNLVWSDNTNLLGATGFYFDPYSESPIGATGATAYLSNGLDYVEVVNGISIGGTACNPALCASRTISQNFELINNTITNNEMLVSPLLSNDGTIVYYEGNQYYQSGNSYSVPYSTNYDSTTYVGAEIYVPTIYAGSVEVKVYQTATLIETLNFTSGTSQTPVYGPVGSDSWEFRIEWTP